jgi:hypothetical protein
MSSPGVEPGLRPSQGRVPSLTLRGRGSDQPKPPNALARSRTWSPTFGGSCALRHTPGAS